LKNRKKVWTIYERINTIKITIICEASIPNENSDKGNNFDCGEPPTKVLKYPAKPNPWTIPKNNVTNPTTLMPSCLTIFPP